MTDSLLLAMQILCIRLDRCGLYLYNSCASKFVEYVRTLKCFVVCVHNFCAVVVIMMIAWDMAVGISCVYWGFPLQEDDDPS